MFNRFNDMLADILSDWLSTMECFWIITVLVVAILFWQRPTSLVGWITYISTTIFQASALPVLGFVSKKSGARTDKLLQETHDAVMAEMGLIKEELALAREERDELKQIMRQYLTRT
jgi:hypothetical protein